LLDIGCSGGGIVFDFLRRGHFAIGLEGSDFCVLNQRGHWSIIPNHLFTCDATKPYSVKFTPDNSLVKFDLISAWEVLEHIREDDFEQFFGNIRNHLRPGGLFVASVATFEDYDPATGAVWHVTVKPREWWEERIRRYGLAPVKTAFVTHDFPRGSGNPLATDWDAQASPHFGFHLVAEAV
jgi:predicted TPR repeat methyltransferase